MPVLIAFFWILLGLALQVLLFNHMSLAGGIALSYLYMLVRMPVEWNRMVQIGIGFFVGLTVDVFCNTPGLHALVCTTTMWLRLPMLHMFIVADDIKSGCPTYHRLGFSIFSRFLAVLLLIHCVLLYTVEAFTLFNFLNLCLKILITFTLTFLLLLAAEVANSTK